MLVEFLLREDVIAGLVRLVCTSSYEKPEDTYLARERHHGWLFYAARAVVRMGMVVGKQRRGASIRMVLRSEKRVSKKKKNLALSWQKTAGCTDQGQCMLEIDELADHDS